MPTKLTYEHVKSYIESKGDTLVTLEYDNNKKLLDIVCGVCTNKYSQTFDHFTPFLISNAHFIKYKFEIT